MQARSSSSRQWTRLAAVVAAGFLSLAATAPAKQTLQAPVSIDAARVALSEPPADLRSSKELIAVIADLRAGNVDRANATWRQFLESGLARRQTTDIDALIQWVLSESYLETNKDLQFHAEKVRYFNQAKKTLREQITAMRSEIASSPEWPKLLPTVAVQKQYAAGRAPVQVVGSVRYAENEAEKYIVDLEQKLNQVGDDAQLANVDLQ